VKWYGKYGRKASQRVKVKVVVANFCKKCNYWNKYCNYENKMAGKGQITSERASS
jgi:hypothetical protein